jgi:hypothetical protein
MVAKGTLNASELSIEEFSQPLKETDGEVALLLDHPAEKVVLAVWDTKEEELVLQWSTGTVERPPGTKSAVMMMAAASDCRVEPVLQDDAIDRYVEPDTDRSEGGDGR